MKGNSRKFDFMRRAARCFSFGRPNYFYLVLTRPEAIREMTGCPESDFCFGSEREALAFVRKIDERTYGNTMTIEARPKESFDCRPNSAWGSYAIPVYICDHHNIDVVGYIFTCGFDAFHMWRNTILNGVRRWKNLHGFHHMTYEFPNFKNNNEND